MTNKPSIRVDYSARFKRDIKRLYKKYRNIQNDLQPLIAALSEGQVLGDAVQHTRYTVYKVRVQNSNVSKGKSGGYRVIYYLKKSDSVILITVYSKSELSDVTTDEIRHLIEEFNEGQ